MVALVAFSDDIWKARESQSLTQAELGERMGVQLLVVYRMLTLKQDARKICITNENNWLKIFIGNENNCPNTCIRFTMKSIFTIITRMWKWISTCPMNIRRYRLAII